MLTETNANRTSADRLFEESCRRWGAEACALPSGDVYLVDFGFPLGSEAGFVRPAVVITDDDVLESTSATSQVIPFASTLRHWPADMSSEWGEAQVHLITTVSSLAAGQHLGAVGPAKLRTLREVLAAFFGMS